MRRPTARTCFESRCDRAKVVRAYTDGGIVTDGTDLARILPAMSLFDPDNAYMAKRQAVIDKLRAFFDRFFGLTG